MFSISPYTAGTGIPLAFAYHLPTRPLTLRQKTSRHVFEAPSSIDDNHEVEQTQAALRSITLEKLDAATEPSLLSDFLMELGACSVAITDHDKDTEYEEPIFREPDYDGDDYNTSDSRRAIEEDEDRENPFAAAIVCGGPAVGKNVWRRCDVTAHFPASFDLEGIVEDVRSTFSADITYKVNPNVPDKDWVSHVQESWNPIVCGNILLRFPWHTEEDVTDAIINDQGHATGDPIDLDKFVQLQLEGGIAFGTGEHPTTQLCLSWIQDTICNDENDINMLLDYGSGSGVLGMASCKLDPNLTAVGLEIDADAILIANSNSQVNDVNMKSYLPEDIIESESCDDESKSMVMKALSRTSVEVLPEEIRGAKYDACVANILAGPLVNLSNRIAGMVKPGGKLGLSGILTRQSSDVIDAYSKYFHSVKVAETKSGWVLITGTRK